MPRLCGREGTSKAEGTSRSGPPLREHSNRGTAVGAREHPKTATAVPAAIVHAAECTCAQSQTGNIQIEGPAGRGNIQIEGPQGTFEHRDCCSTAVPVFGCSLNGGPCFWMILGFGCSLAGGPSIWMFPRPWKIPRFPYPQGRGILETRWNF